MQVNRVPLAQGDLRGRGGRRENKVPVDLQERMGQPGQEDCAGRSARLDLLVLMALGG